MEKGKKMHILSISIDIVCIVFICIGATSAFTGSNKEQTTKLEQSIDDNYKRIETNLSGIAEQIDVIQSTTNKLQNIIKELQRQTTELESGFDDIQKFYRDIGTGLQTTIDKLQQLEKLNRETGKEIEKL